MLYAASILAMAASASAHMTLGYPVPFGQPDRSPLSPDGSNFPCQTTGTYTVTSMNAWNAGETKDIAFNGSAIHGGGSCQFSITTDAEPNKDTQWKVIHSVEGGCPGAADGNLPEDGSVKTPTFPVKLPEGLPSGTYTFGWTWFNKIGNREIYMNCAPLQVGGGGDTSAAADVSSVLGDLPDMFVANLPPQECTTIETTDVEFPDPGDSLVKGDSVTLGSVSGSGCASMTKLGAGAGSLGSPSQATGAPASSGGAASSGVASSAPAATSAAATSAAASTPAASTLVPSNTGGVFAPGASSAAGTGAASSTSAASAPAQTGGNSTPSGDCTACSNSGAVVCIGSSQFGLCNNGCAVAQDLATGTTCSNGVISRRSVRRFPRAHLHRRHGSEI